MGLAQPGTRLPAERELAERRLTKETGHDLKDTLMFREVLEGGSAEQAAMAVDKGTVGASTPR